MLVVDVLLMSINFYKFYANGVANDPPPICSTFVNTMYTGNSERKSHLASSIAFTFQNWCRQRVFRLTDLVV